jgi:hypothetical protein
MDTSGRGRLTLNEFMDIFDAVSLKWASKEPKQAWFAISHSPARFLGKIAVSIYDWPHFESIVCTAFIYVPTTP